MTLLGEGHLKADPQAENVHVYDVPGVLKVSFKHQRYKCTKGCAISVEVNQPRRGFADLRRGATPERQPGTPDPVRTQRGAATRTAIRSTSARIVHVDRVGFDSVYKTRQDKVCDGYANAVQVDSGVDEEGCGPTRRPDRVADCPASNKDDISLFSTRQVGHVHHTLIYSVTERAQQDRSWPEKVCEETGWMSIFPSSLLIAGP